MLSIIINTFKGMQQNFLSTCSNVKSMKRFYQFHIKTLLLMQKAYLEDYENFFGFSHFSCHYGCVLNVVRKLKKMNERLE